MYDMDETSAPTMDATAASSDLPAWMISSTTIFVAIVTVTVTAVWIRLIRLFRKDIDDARQSYQNLKGRRVIDTGTALGPVEVVIVKSGNSNKETPPVLVVHGIFGGIDQGCLLARNHLPSDCQVISVSRFGYLGSPLPSAIDTNDRVQVVFHQADALAAVLDELDIDRAVVFATSAGATSALAFAMQHSKRCAGLILLSPNSPGLVDISLPPRPLAERLFQMDFLFWMVVTYFSQLLFRPMGVPKDLRMSDEEKQEVLGVVKTILPVSPRADGIVLDMFVSNPAIQDLQVNMIANTPVLILAARDDPLTLYDNSLKLSQAIAGATLASLPSGGHMLLGQQVMVREAIKMFLSTIRWYSSTERGRGRLVQESIRV